MNEKERIQKAYEVLGDDYKVVKLIEGKEHTMFKDGSGSVERWIEDKESPVYGDNTKSKKHCLVKDSESEAE